MLHSTDYRELRNGKRYQTSDQRIMSHHGITEEIANRSSSENVEGEIPEFQTLTQEAVNEQIRGFIAPLIRQLEEFIRLVQGMTASCHPNSYPRTELGTTSGTAIHQSDNWQKFHTWWINKWMNACMKKHFFCSKHPDVMVSSKVDDFDIDSVCVELVFSTLKFQEDTEKALVFPGNIRNTGIDLLKFCDYVKFCAIVEILLKE